MNIKDYKLSTIATCIVLIVGKSVGIGLNCSQGLPVGSRVGIILAIAASSATALVLIAAVFTLYNKHRVNKHYTTLTAGKESRFDEIPLDVINMFKDSDELFDTDNEFREADDVDRQKADGAEHRKADDAEHQKTNDAEHQKTNDAEHRKANDAEHRKANDAEHRKANDAEHRKANDAEHRKANDLETSSNLISKDQESSNQKNDQQQSSDVRSTVVDVAGKTHEGKNVKNDFVSAVTMVMNKQRKTMHVNADGSYQIFCTEVQESEKMPIKSEQSIESELTQSNFASKLKDMENSESSSVSRLQMSRANKGSQGRCM
ncbi:hypothetical protein EDL79_01940 [Ehrlichia ruminantium]|uniref:Uncharacterized protein n=1 Tax=Ehrlichia ruminantium TaxID=779 RepID=A0AAE6Q8W6_EHRRU|nr:hypothetical protein [Ehrlichia ruminantium]QGR02428.1 hypothetical protein EDL81_01945 [Ehrlichia ruminantium]QGR03347.1 hypothetical protein EDL80_01940 [Ehrlichia ruminantium]QGR04274.1 hypothetical protein EDL79_01940 [Ehrlichia ruminantium]